MIVTGEIYQLGWNESVQKTLRLRKYHKMLYSGIWESILQCERGSAERRFADKEQTAIRQYVASVLWLVVFLLFSSIAWQWITYCSADKQLTEYAQGLVRRSSYDRKPTHEIRLLIQSKAEQLWIPLQPDQVLVSGQGEKLHVDIIYDEEIKTPVINHELYRIEFVHNLYPQIIPY